MKGLVTAIVGLGLGGLEIVRDSGNHDCFGTGRWCEAAVAALGL